MCTNLAWGTMVEMGSHYFRRDDVDPVCLSVAPLTHAAGVMAMMLFPLGATRASSCPGSMPLKCCETSSASG